MSNTLTLAIHNNISQNKVYILDIKDVNIFLAIL